MGGSLCVIMILNVKVMNDEISYCIRKTILNNKFQKKTIDFILTT